MYLALRTKRSWLNAVLLDLQWLKTLGGAFADFNADDFVEFMALAKTPLAAVRSLQKDCFSLAAVTAALLHPPIVPKSEVAIVDAVPMVIVVEDTSTCLRCDFCDYTCDDSKQIATHSRINHSERHPVNRCINTHWCSVCGIFRHHRAGLLVHCQDCSRICGLSRLLSSEFIGDEEASLLEIEAAANRLQHVKAGRGQHYVEKTAVRDFGP